MSAHGAQVVRWGFLSMQVCIPKDWTDEQARDFLEAEQPCGTTGGWHVRKSAPERVCCETRSGFVHLMLEA